jgi:hypothetical protein
MYYLLEKDSIISKENDRMVEPYKTKNEHEKTVVKRRRKKRSTRRRSWRWRPN